MGIAFEWLDDYVEQKIVTSLLAELRPLNLAVNVGLC